MSRLLELEVFSPAKVMMPESFFADVETVGRDILGREFSSQFRYSGGETVPSRESGLQITDAEKLKYYYVSKVAPYDGLGALDIASYASFLFSERRLEDTIGGIDLVQKMKIARGGEVVTEELCEEFHYIEKVKSARHPGLAVLVLKQLTSDNKLARMGAVATDTIENQHFDLFTKPEAVELNAVHQIAGSIPFARIKRAAVEEGRIDEAIRELTTNSLRNNVHVKIGPISHSAD